MQISRNNGNSNPRYEQDRGTVCVNLFEKQYPKRRTTNYQGTRGRFYRPLVPTAAKTTSNQIATYKTTAGNSSVTYSYSYDNNGNITSVTYQHNPGTAGSDTYTATTTYAYDSANQLIRENNEAGGFTRTWTYDNAGNILERREYAYTTGELDENGGIEVAYEYPAVTDPANNTVWGDLLISFDGKTIEYDAIGNPTKFGVTENGGGRAFTWEHGRQLKSLSENGTTWNYTYASGGMRTSRSNGSSTYSYIYNGSQLTQMKVGSDTLTFTYDAGGTPLTVTYNGTRYYYATNLQGDITAILDASGNTVAGYSYDAWGNCTPSATAAMSTTPKQNCTTSKAGIMIQMSGNLLTQMDLQQPARSLWVIICLLTAVTTPSISQTPRG